MGTCAHPIKKVIRYRYRVLFPNPTNTQYRKIPGFECLPRYTEVRKKLFISKYFYHFTLLTIKDLRIGHFTEKNRGPFINRPIKSLLILLKISLISCDTLHFQNSFRLRRRSDIFCAIFHKIYISNFARFNKHLRVEGQQLYLGVKMKLLKNRFVFN
ncbi:hypothetical protein BpHYR1_037299 [Brachionus plicatilis]|uniref:Uncharacterized protein n=1 Tax=Brachionus plicatilis TaxID=10195 RepID=A0A3M7RXW8_BRAPC|nr:hypothetical protein BpHYR1_037299 [Brachionus plicatilis]